METESGTLLRAKKVPLEGAVYCLTHTCVHDDTLDPYGEGRPTCFDDMGHERTKAMVHRSLFVGMLKGDYVEDGGL